MNQPFERHPSSFKDQAAQMCDGVDILIISNDINLNGITNVILNYTTALVKRGFTFAIAVNRPLFFPNVEIFNALGIRVYSLTDKTTSLVAYYRELLGLLKKLQPRIVHIHGSSSMVCVELVAAARAGVKRRIVHCHNSNCTHPVMHRILKPVINLLCTDRLACSTNAGVWQFGSRPYTIIPNAFKVQQFRFDAKKRELFRNRYGIDEADVVIGNVARFNEVKNQTFCIDVFEELSSSSPRYWLVLIGDGPLKDTIRAKASCSQFSERIIVAGELQDASVAYSAFDVLLFPSLYEGLGITVVEAQISGLPCIVSNAVPDSALISCNTSRLDLNEPIQVWTHEVKKAISSISSNRTNTSLTVDASEFDISKCANLLEECYGDHMG